MPYNLFEFAVKLLVIFCTICDIDLRKPVQRLQLLFSVVCGHAVLSRILALSVLAGLFTSFCCLVAQKGKIVGSGKKVRARSPGNSCFRVSGISLEICSLRWAGEELITWYPRCCD